MDEKTFIIIFAVINLAVWCIAVDFMAKQKHTVEEMQKRTTAWEKKTLDYYHQAFQSFIQLTEINLNAQNEFIEKLSDKMNVGESNGNAEKNRE